jgi:hypothetical protein
MYNITPYLKNHRWGLKPAVNVFMVCCMFWKMACVIALSHFFKRKCHSYWSNCVMKLALYSLIFVWNKMKFQQIVNENHSDKQKFTSFVIHFTW